MDPATSLSMAGGLAKELRKARVVHYAEWAGFIIAYFDWLLTFDSEIKLIWNVEGARMRVLFFMTRYLPLVYFPLLLYTGSLTDSLECTILDDVVAILFAIAALCSVLVLTIRTWAVWDKGKCFAYLLFGMYAMVIVLMFLLIGMSWKSMSGICSLQYQSLYIAGAFVVETTFDTVILILMLIRGTSLYYSGRESRLFRTLYRDGIMFYVYITSVSIANVVMLFGQGDYQDVLLMFQGAIRSVLACRVVLHIRMELHGEPRPVKVPPRTNSDHIIVLIEGGAVPRPSA